MSRKLYYDSTYPVINYTPRNLYLDYEIYTLKVLQEMYDFGNSFGYR